MKAILRTVRLSDRWSASWPDWISNAPACPAATRNARSAADACDGDCEGDCGCDGGLSVVALSASAGDVSAPTATAARAAPRRYLGTMRSLLGGGHCPRRVPGPKAGHSHDPRHVAGRSPPLRSSKHVRLPVREAP